MIPSEHMVGIKLMFLRIIKPGVIREQEESALPKSLGPTGVKFHTIRDFAEGFAIL